MTLYLDNPAGRAFAVLSEFGSNVGVSVEFRHAWAVTLGVPVEAVPEGLVQVRALLASVVDAAESLSVPGYEAIPNDVQTLLDTSVSPVGMAPNHQSASAMPHEVPMRALGMFGAYLHAIAPDGDVPSPDERSDLIDQVNALMASVLEDASLPPDVKRSMLRRLREMLEALQHLEIGGPEGVRLAAEALAATALTHSEAVPNGTITQAIAVANRAWKACKVAANVVSTITALATGAQALGLMEAPTVLQLNPGTCESGAPNSGGPSAGPDQGQSAPSPGISA